MAGAGTCGRQPRGQRSVSVRLILDQGFRSDASTVLREHAHECVHVRALCRRLPATLARALLARSFTRNLFDQAGVAGVGQEMSSNGVIRISRSGKMARISSFPPSAST